MIYLHIEGRVLALQMAAWASILGIPSLPLSIPGIIPDHKLG